MIKNTRFTKNTRLQNIDWFSEVIQCKLAVKAKGKVTPNENDQKMLQAKTLRNSLQTRDKENGDSSNACVRLYRSLKLIIDYHSYFQACNQLGTS